MIQQVNLEIITMTENGKSRKTKAHENLGGFMKRTRIRKLILGVTLIVTTALGTICCADNPVIQTIFTADPAPMVHEGTLYLYTGHDEDNAPNNRYLMHDYRCYTSTDMVNWTDPGPVLDIRKVFTWSGDDAGLYFIGKTNILQDLFHLVPNPLDDVPEKRTRGPAITIFL